MLVPPALVLLLALLVVDAQRRERRSGLDEQRAYAVLLDLQRVRARLTEAETAARAYLLTGEASFLDASRDARAEMTAAFERMRASIRRDADRARLAAVEPLVLRRLDHSADLVARRAAGEVPAETAAVVVREGAALMGAARDGLAELERSRAARLEEYARQRERRARVGVLLVIGGALASAGVTLLLHGLLARHARETAATNLLLEEQAVELEIQAAELEAQALELEESAQSLEAQREYLMTVLDTNPSVVCVKSAAGRIQLANRAAAEVLGLEREAVIGRLDSEIDLDEADVEHFRAEDRMVLETSRVHVVEEQPILVPATREVRWFEKRKAPLQPRDGAPPAVLVIAQDITERLLTEEALRRSRAETERTQQEILVRLAQAAEFRDDDTGHHTRRVGALAAEIARLLGLPDHQVELIRRVAPLHDVGKIGIPDSILLKPGRLNAHEFEIMKLHTVIGGKILGGGSSEIMTLAAQIALSHHERWDAKGYPHALGDHDIPVAARIVSVADVVDALSNDRPYRRAWPLEEVQAEMRAQRGVMFDPTLVDACLEIISTEAGRERWRGA